MDRENILRFTNSIVLLSKLLTNVEDKFLRRKLYEKMFDMVSVFIAHKNNSSPTSHNQNLLNSINNLLDYLEYLAHISEDNTSPLLFAQRNLLKFKLHILKQKKKEKSSMKSSSSEVLSSDAVSLLIPKSSVRVKPRIKSDSNKERIFNYIKKTPEVRTKDVMREFSALSGRTVKRSLKELTDEGFLKKISDGASVYYLVTE